MEKKLIRVRDVMKADFNLVDGQQTVAEALCKMRDTDARALIIDKRHENDEYGIVLFSDIAKKVLAKDRAPERVNIYEIMSKPAFTVDAEMDIRYCARLFSRFGLSRAPVMDGSKVIGTVSYHDMIMRGVAEHLFCALE